MKRKNLVMLIILFISCFLFTGCANVDYTYLNDGKNITQIFSIELDTESITLAGVNPSEIKKIINEKIISHFNYYTSNFNTLVNNLMMDDKISVEMAKKLKTSVTKVEPVWINSVLTTQLTFSSVTDGETTIDYSNIFNLYYNSELYPETEEAEFIYEGLIKKISETDFTVFNSQLAQEYRAEINTALEEAGINITSGVNYSYTHGTTYRRVHSDADSITYNGTYYLHTWELSDETETITLYRSYANQYLWYLIAIGICVVTVIVLLIIVKVKKVKEKKNEVEIISPDSNKSEVEIEIIPPKE